MLCFAFTIALHCLCYCLCLCHCLCHWLCYCLCDCLCFASHLYKYLFVLPRVNYVLPRIAIINGNYCLALIIHCLVYNCLGNYNYPSHMYRVLPECFHFEAHLNSYLCLFPQPRLSHLYRSFLLPPSSTPQLNTTPSLIPSLGRLEHSSQHHGQKEGHREHWKFQPIVAKHFSSIRNSNRKS